MAARRAAARAHRLVPAAILDDDVERRSGVFHLHPQRSRGHLRHRLSRHLRHRSRHQSGRARHAGGAHVRGAAGVCVDGDRHRRPIGGLRTRGAPGSARQLLPQAVPRLSCGVAGAGADPGVRHARVFCESAPRRHPVGRRPRGGRRAARGGGIRGAAPARSRRGARRRDHGVAEPGHRAGREYLSWVAAAGHERARPVRVRAAAGAHARAGIAPSCWIACRAT